MAAPTPGLNYDIFISYRHNDNKTPGGAAGEGWVTEFVNHLTTELESIVKGGVSIYFDSDPQHGFREADQGNASLDAHLNSVIFIPILSQTYCDTNSHAWTKEFMPFVQNSSHDKLGPSIKLPSGNVVSRMLPVCIHELDEDDLQLVESKLEGKLRAIPFIFKSPGVNRPLRAHEEDPMKNLNRTLYRDQINKLAVAAREIINTVRGQDLASGASRSIPAKKVLPEGNLKAPTTIRSIAVFPLVFSSQNPGEEFLSQGFAEDLFSSLRQIKALRTSIHGLSSPVNGSHPASGQSPGTQATMILSGSMTVQGDTVSIHVRLIQTKTEAAVWQNDFHCEKKDLFSLRPRIIQELCDALGITLKESEKKVVQELVHTGAAAVQMYWKGRYHWRKRGNDLITSLQCFEKAADLDPNFAPAHAGIANAAVLLGYYEMIPFEEAISRCRDAAMTALSIDPTAIDAYYALAYIALCYEWAWPDAEPNFTKVFDINPASPTALKKYRLSLTHITCNFEEAESESPGCVPYFLQAYALMHKGQFEEALQVAQIAAKKDPNSFMAQRAVGLSYLALGHEREAIDTLMVAAQLSNRHSWTLFDLIAAYATMAHTQGAQEIMEEAMERINTLPARINDFYFQTA